MGCTVSRSKVKGFRDFYELGQKVGTGAFAQVRICKARGSGVERVVKLISKPYKRDDIELEVSLLREVGSGECENVVQFHEFFEDAHFFYSVMEYCSGGELLDLLDAEEVTISERTVASWIKQILLGVNHVHRLGIVHRDVKPQNLLFANGRRQVLKLIDFGLSYRMPPRELLDEPCGTPEFVAPEMILGRYGRKIDIWAVGVLLYVVLFGRFPFRGDDEKQLFRNIVDKQPSYVSTVTGYAPSGSAVDFCRSLLTKNFKARPTANQALGHEWLKEVPQAGSAEPSIVIPQEIRRSARDAASLLRDKHPATPVPTPPVSEIPSIPSLPPVPPQPATPPAAPTPNESLPAGISIRDQPRPQSRPLLGTMKSIASLATSGPRTKTASFPKPLLEEKAIAMSKASTEEPSAQFLGERRTIERKNTRVNVQNYDSVYADIDKFRSQIITRLDSSESEDYT